MLLPLSQTTIIVINSFFVIFIITAMVSVGIEQAIKLFKEVKNV